MLNTHRISLIFLTFIAAISGFIKAEKLYYGVKVPDEEFVKKLEDPQFAQNLFDTYQQKEQSRKRAIAKWTWQFAYVFGIHYFMKNFSDASLYVHHRLCPEPMRSEYTEQALKICPLLFAWVFSSFMQERVAELFNDDPDMSANITGWTAALCLPNLKQLITIFSKRA